MLQAISWYGATMLAVIAAMAVLQWRTAKQLRLHLENAASILYRFSRTAGALAVFVLVGMFIVGWRYRLPTDQLSQAIGAVVLIATLSVMSLAASWMRLELERTLRPTDWSRPAMMRIHLFFHLPVFGTGLLAAMGHLLTLLIFQRFGHEAPNWVGALWVLAAVAGLMLWPTHRMLGEAVEPPADLLHEYHRSAAVSDPPPLVVLDTRGAQLVNAFAFWRPGKSWIAVGDGLLAALDRPQVLSVLMHELGHVVHRDSRRHFLILITFQTIATALLVWAGAASLWTAFATLAIAAAVVVPWFSRRAEHRCDRFAAERTDPRVMGAALRRLHELNFQPERHDEGHHTTHPDLAHRLEAMGVGDAMLPAAEDWKPLQRSARWALVGVWLIVALAAMALMLGLTLVIFDRGSVRTPWFAIAAVTWLAYYGIACVYRYSSSVRARRLPPWIAAAMVAYWPLMYGLATGMRGGVLAACVLAAFAGAWVLMIRYRAASRPARRRSAAARVEAAGVAEEHEASAVAKSPMA